MEEERNIGGRNRTEDGKGKGRREQKIEEQKIGEYSIR